MLQLHAKIENQNIDDYGAPSWLEFDVGRHNVKCEYDLSS